jgi:Family of unknown function (DUF5670)
MYFTIAVVLAALWLIGILTSTIIGGAIHLLLVNAFLLVLARLISGRNYVSIDRGD